MATVKPLCFAFLAIMSLAAVPTAVAAVDAGAALDLTMPAHIDIQARVADCNGGDVNLLGQDGFRFTENNLEWGCLLLEQELTAPDGVTQGALLFQAKRSMLSVGTTNPTRVDFISEVSARMPSEDESPHRFEFFPRGAPEASSQGLLRHDLDFREGQVTITWHLEETLSPDANRLDFARGGRDFTVDVWNLQVVYFDVPLEATIETEDSVLHGGVGLQQQLTLDIDIPPEALQRTGEISVWGPPGIHSAVAYTGTEKVPLFPAKSTESRSYWTLPLDQVDQQQIQIVMVQSTGPTLAGSFSVMGFIAYALVAVIGLWATRELISHRKEDTEARVRSQDFLVYVLACASFAFSLSLALAWWRYMLFWPPTLEASVLYGLLLVAGIGFAIAALNISRVHRQEVLHTLEDQARHNRELSRSNEELEQFASIASHDLREPLRAIALHAQLIQEKNRLGSPRSVMEAARRMDLQLQALLKFSRVAGAKGLDDEVDLDQVVDQAWESLAVLRKQSKAQLQKLPLPTVRGNQGLLTGVIQNLLVNALHHRHPERSPRIKVQAVRRGDGFEIQVIDNGRGIRASKARDVWAIFERGDQQKEAGRGIGLAVVKRSIEKHGGTVGLRAREHGTQFWFWLPDQMGPQVPEGAAPSPDPSVENDASTA